MSGDARRDELRIAMPHAEGIARLGRLIARVAGETGGERVVV